VRAPSSARRPQRTDALLSGTSLGAAAVLVKTGGTFIYIPAGANNSWLPAAGGPIDASTRLAKLARLPTENLSLTIVGKAPAIPSAQYLIPAN
jgi:hypothetical protein